MAADAITGVEEQCKAHGINHYISKPFDPEEVERMHAEFNVLMTKLLDEIG
ncbi:MAG: hypothetical protein IBX70_12250 [Clostridia bacterium]|nr:hypothetical protein [Clostridia bacterium]